MLIDGCTFHWAGRPHAWVMVTWWAAWVPERYGGVFVRNSLGSSSSHSVLRMFHSAALNARDRFVLRVPLVLRKSFSTIVESRGRKSGLLSETSSSRGECYYFLLSWVSLSSAGFAWNYNLGYFATVFAFQRSQTSAHACGGTTTVQLTRRSHRKRQEERNLRENLYVYPRVYLYSCIYT